MEAATGCVVFLYLARHDLRSRVHRGSASRSELSSTPLLSSRKPPSETVPGPDSPLGCQLFAAVYFSATDFSYPNWGLFLTSINSENAQDSSQASAVVSSPISRGYQSDSKTILPVKRRTRHIHLSTITARTEPSVLPAACGAEPSCDGRPIGDTHIQTH